MTNEEEYWYLVKAVIVIAAAYYRYTRRKNLKPPRKPRRFGVRPVFQQRKILGEYCNFFREIKSGDPDIFFKYTRMSEERYDYLLDKLKVRLTKKSPLAISPGERLAFTLRYLSTGDSQQSTGWAFRLGRSTCHKIVRETCKAIWDELHPLYLKPPTEAEWKSYADGFWESWNLPNCCGSMDGKHVAIQAPKKSGSKYFNYKHTFSMVLFAVCDHNYIFRYINVGAYGSCGDSTVFNSSSFGKLLIDKTLNLPDAVHLPHSPEIILPYYFVGDEAFPLRRNLLRPYPSLRTRDLTRHENIFNYRLSRARRVIENSFGILASRWRIFRKPIIADPYTVELIIKACICLHNYIKLSDSDANTYCPPNWIDREDANHKVILGDWREELKNKGSAVTPAGRISANNFAQAAREMRDEFAAWLSDNEHGIVEWQEEIINAGREKGYTGK